MSEIRRILVVLEAGLDEPRVLDGAAELAQDTEAEVVVLAVADVESQRFEALPLSEHLAEAEAGAQRAVMRLMDKGLRARALTRSGPAAAAVIECAEAEAADLIVVGTTRRGPVAERLLGSLPLELIRGSGRQVLVVTGPAR